MTSSWHEEKRLFLQALELSNAEQASFVSRSAAHPEHAQRVLELLKHHNRDDSFLDSPVTLEPGVLGGIRDAIDGFTIKAIIGRGSMGTVYRALQQQPRRTVAIKLMRNDFRVDQASLARFENEAELLAKLKHPGISHVYQSGTVEIDQESRPWFAMELISGGTLGDYLTAVNLSLEVKLGLVRQIVRAVAYAHQHGVIHRDLKPSNILVQLSQTADLAGSPPAIKIVDFGIAKLNQENVATQLTMTHDILGTLNYMSPERLSRDVEADHRCDIYALGVVAFEILTGQLPYDRTSESLATTIKQLEFESPKRLTEVNASLPADLDVIVAKAMAPDPQVRYESAEDLLLDIQRFEQGQPIRARRPTMVYRLSRYLRRNRILIAASSITIIALLIGMAATMISAHQAHIAADASRYEADKANAINSFFTNDLLGQLFQSGMDQDTLEAAKRSTDTIESQVASMYADRPLIEAAIRNELGSIYYNFRSLEDAQKQYGLARELWESQLGLRHPDTLKAINNLGQTQMALGPTDETEELLRLAYQLRLEVLGEAEKPTLHSLNNYAEFLRMSKRFDEAMELFSRGLEIQRRSPGEADKVMLTTAANLGSLYLSQNKLDEALALHKESHFAARHTYGIQHSLALQTGIRWVQTLDRAERYGEAEREMRALVKIYEHQQGRPTRLITPYRLMARIHRHQKKFQEAMLLLEQALEIAVDAEDTRNTQRIERDINRVRQEQR